MARMAPLCSVVCLVVDVEAVRKLKGLKAKKHYESYRLKWNKTYTHGISPLPPTPTPRSIHGWFVKSGAWKWRKLRSDGWHFVSCSQPVSVTSQTSITSLAQVAQVFITSSANPFLLFVGKERTNMAALRGAQTRCKKKTIQKKQSKQKQQQQQQRQ